MADETPRFVSIPQFCERTTLCRQTVYNMIERGEIAPPVRLTPNRVAFPAPVVDAWFASRAEAA
ncbi:AlpA family phage regulatory protein [Brevundimonas sp.]|uniref:helix-turn-helix transcriptional regulator n=1 Tax=Brevundimonas sp. TaxID=1871086 RepID=UPI002D4F9C87|nr:AlpA family phage regulatory protein [Brevundimonas sp.]HYC98484.1 AlpA family phage regulatory protein [Brevundimonas sp.]